MDSLAKVARLSLIASHYAARANTLPYLPLRMWVEPTNYCNLRCVVCPNATDTTSHRGFMGVDLFRSVIEQAANHTYDINVSHRGESLFHPDLAEMITRCTARRIKSRLHSNATILSSDRSRELIMAGLNLMSFSFDGFTKQTYERIRVGADFDKALANILAFLRLKRQLGARKPYTILQVIEFEGNTASRSDLDRFLANFQELPLDKLYIKKPHNWAGNVPAANEESCSAFRPVSPCTFPWYSLTILWDGTVVPCPQDWYGVLPLGNVNHQSLWEIWNGEPIKLLRKRMKELDLTGVNPCHGCDRVTRPTVFGVPYENLKAFLGETVLGYSLVRRFIKR